MKTVMPHTFTAAMVFLVFLLCPAKSQAVAFTEMQYQQAVTDIERLYTAAPGTSPNLALLRAENLEDMLHIFPPGEDQGILTVKIPLKADNITMIQIPHAFFDLHSLDIGQQMFDSEWADVLMVNTQHRYETDNSDLARLRYSLFTAVVDALRIMEKQVKVIQVHGYNEKKRSTISAQQTDMILSNGSAIPDTYMLQIQSCLRDSSMLLARLYGRDVFELGATVNPVGKLLRRHTDHQIHFLHIELPRRVREQMVSGQQFGPQQMRQVMKCLTQ